MSDLQTEEAEIEPTKIGWFARSPRYGIAATGDTREEATANLSALVLLMQKADRLRSENARFSAQPTKREGE